MNINIGLKSVAAKAATAATVPTPLVSYCTEKNDRAPFVALKFLMTTDSAYSLTWVLVHCHGSPRETLWKCNTECVFVTSGLITRPFHSLC